MYILLILFGIIGALLVWIIRLQMAARAASEVKDGIDTARGAYRRAKFRNKAETDPLSLLSDAREAVAAILTALSQTDSQLTEAQEGHLRNIFEQRLGFDNPVETLARAKWLVRAHDDPFRVYDLVKKLIAEECSEAQKRDLVDLAFSVDEWAGEQSDIRSGFIQHMRGRLGV